MRRPRIILLQLPIPPAAPEPIVGNVPLAAGYLKLLARARGLERHFEIDIFPPHLANTLSDIGLVAELADRRPALVGLTCYLWNIERSLWIAARLKERLPDVKILLGGPEITIDNAWVLAEPALDFAAIGEGEQTFAELLSCWATGRWPEPGAIAGLYVAQRPPHPAASGSTELAEVHEGTGFSDAHLQLASATPRFRTPLQELDTISSPYLEGILDAADEQMLLLETVRGCIFKCKFCYYPKSYDALYFASREKIAANLAHARERGVREVVLLDPTLNQRRDFADFVRFLADQNPRQQFTYFGELRGEGITPEIAGLLRAANFEEVEIGLQSVDPLAQDLMDRPNNLRAFERGARAMLAAGIRVKVDLIIGLPGDTVESVRRGIQYFVDTEFCRNTQVFQLSILPGTAFRQEAGALGLRFQPRPPYYTLETPTLKLPEMVDLMREAQERFGVDFDAPSAPCLALDDDADPASVWRVDLDGWPAGRGLPRSDRGRYHAVNDALPAAERRAQAFTLWLRSGDFARAAGQGAALIQRLLADNPHTTLQVVLEPSGDPRSISPRVLEQIRQACYSGVTYLDRFYSLSPGRPRGAKRLVVVGPAHQAERSLTSWADDLADYATVVWRPSVANVAPASLQ